MQAYRKFLGKDFGKIFWRFSEYIFRDLTPQYEQNFHREIFGLRTVVGLTLDEIMEMPIGERRLYTLLWNQKIEDENNQIKNQSSEGSSMADVQRMAAQAHSE